MLDCFRGVNLVGLEEALTDSAVYIGDIHSIVIKLKKFNLSILGANIK